MVDSKKKKTAKSRKKKKSASESPAQSWVPDGILGWKREGRDFGSAGMTVLPGAGEPEQHPQDAGTRT